MANDLYRCNRMSMERTRLEDITTTSLLEEVFEIYENTAQCNDDLWATFTRLTDQVDYLKEHRDFIERNKLGFGDRAFQFMWMLLLKHVHASEMPPNLLEIGVYKGQIISLWALLCARENLPLTIHGVSPLKGEQVVTNRWLIGLLRRVSRRFAEKWESANFYPDEDYQKIIRALFGHFQLSFDVVRMSLGYSAERAIIEKVSEKRFAVIYVDGDHRYEGVVADIRNYSPMLCTGGFLVMDDASLDLPGTRFWKGHRSVADACKIIEPLGFKNVLNVGHNRVYQRLH